MAVALGGDRDLAGDLDLGGAEDPGFAAEKTLTADTVPVDVDAVLSWTVSAVWAAQGDRLLEVLDLERRLQRTEVPSGRRPATLRSP